MAHLMARPRPVLLLILDGWGHREDSAHNAIAKANAPNWRHLLATYPHTLVETHGEYVGLPDGQMGNSEVGHMNIGSGRIVYQDLTRIDAAIKDGSFFENAALAGACDAARTNGGTLHIMGLVSPGGVHSHEDHIFAMLDLAAHRGVSRIAVHAFLDGRDTPPRSARPSLEKLEVKCAAIAGARIASVSGRYFAMDRDKRWDRVRLAYDAVADAASPLHAKSAVEALDLAYARDENDEFVKPTVVGSGVPVADGDAMVFMNFRADRARELSHAFVDADFTDFARPRRIALSAFVSLTSYEQGLAVTAIAYQAPSRSASPKRRRTHVISAPRPSIAGVTSGEITTTSAPAAISVGTRRWATCPPPTTTTRRPRSSNPTGYGVSRSEGAGAWVFSYTAPFSRAHCWVSTISAVWPDWERLTAVVSLRSTRLR